VERRELKLRGLEGGRKALCGALVAILVAERKGPGSQATGKVAMGNEAYCWVCGNTGVLDCLRCKGRKYIWRRRDDPDGSSREVQEDYSESEDYEAD